MQHQLLAVRKRFCPFVRRLLAAVRIVAALAFCATQANAAELLATNEAARPSAERRFRRAMAGAQGSGSS